MYLVVILLLTAIMFDPAPDGLAGRAARTDTEPRVRDVRLRRARGVGVPGGPPEWPHSPTRPTPIWVRSALVELEHRLDTWQTPLPLRHQREAMTGITLAPATTALALRWSAEGPELVSTMVWLGATLARCRRLLWCPRVRARLATLEDRLSELSQPGLIAVHHVRARIG